MSETPHRNPLCECPAAGFCKRHQMKKTPNEHRICSGARGASICVKFFEAWERGEAGATAPKTPIEPGQVIRGLGDLVSRGLSAVGVKPCAGCKKRAAKLNHWLPARRKPLSAVEYTGPVRRNLLMHIYPLASSEMWQWNIDQIKRHLDTFTGRRIVAVATSSRTATAKDIDDIFGGQVEILDVPNSKRLGEVASFPKLLESIVSPYANSITFYCHSKGSSENERGNGTGDRDVLKRWADWMYRLCLDDPERVERLLVNHGCAGAFRKLKRIGGAPWYYSGTFYWFRDCHVHQRNWRYVESKYYGSESWPGMLFNESESAVLGLDRVGSLYDARTWDKMERDLRGEPQIIVKPASCDLTIITPTGDRPFAFGLCERWMQRQTFAGSVQWIVTDDGVRPTTTTAGQEYLRINPSRNDPPHTLARNLRQALPLVRGEHVAIIEDDDWYCPQYLESLTDRLRQHPLVGMGRARYYWPRVARYRLFPEHRHASLCRTGFRRELLANVLEHYRTDALEADMRLWRDVGGFIDPGDWAVSMKQMPGRAGGGGPPEKGTADDSREVLRRWIGEDVEAYQPLLPKPPADLADSRVVVYTVCLGGYDKIRKPRRISPHVRYVAITDGAAPAPWEIIRPFVDLPNDRASRWYKTHPGRLFPDPDWTLYVDAQLELQITPEQFLAECLAWCGPQDFYAFDHHERSCVYDEAREVIRVRKDTNRKLVEQQVDRYRSAGFREMSGLYLGGMLLRSWAAGGANRIWWSEIERGSVRDQISLPVALQRSGVAFGALPALWWQHWFLRHPHQRHWRGVGQGNRRSSNRSRQHRPRTAGKGRPRPKQRRSR